MILMLGTDVSTPGGMASVVQVYQDAGLLDKWSIEYVPTHCDSSKIRKLQVVLKATVIVIKCLFSKKVSLIHMHVSYGASFWRKSWFIMLAKLFRVPVIFHLHGSEFAKFYNKRCGWIRKKMVSHFLTQVDHILVLSTQWKQYISSITKNPNVTVVFNPVVYDASYACGKRKRESYTLLFLGQLGQRKGIYDLLKAVKILKKKYPSIKLWCGGDGELDEVKQAAKENDVADHVQILGWIKGEEKTRLVNTATIYVLPSYNEGLPMGILEAMSAGLPVVSTTIGGIPDAIESGIEGLLVEPGDPKQLANALGVLLSDKEKRNQIALVARAKVANIFSVDVVIPQVELLYKKYGALPH